MEPLNGKRLSEAREHDPQIGKLYNGPNGMSGDQAAFEQKLNGLMVPQVGARDRMVPFDGTICG